jgi:hypothetical protein
LINRLRPDAFDLPPLAFALAPLPLGRQDTLQVAFLRRNYSNKSPSPKPIKRENCNRLKLIWNEEGSLRFLGSQ